ncbi:conserved exported hypothetical protein [uncultured Gammaproteobacteria bacterium]
MSLTFLAVPLISVLMAFGFAVVGDPQTAYFDTVYVPARLATDTGYSGVVVLSRLGDEIKKIETEAATAAKGRKLQLVSDKSVIGMLADYLRVTPLIRVVQEAIGLIPFSFYGDVVVDAPAAAFYKNGPVDLVIRGYDNTSKRKAIFIRAQGSTDDLDGLIRAAAFETVQLIDPYLLAAYQFRKDYRIKDYTSTIELIRRDLAGSKKGLSRKWMYNLYGVVFYQQGDKEGAIEMFKQALAIDPQFTSPRLNMGVVQTRLGRYDEAIQSFRTLTTDYRKTESKTTIAAAYSEWGFALALLGRTEEAFAMFRKSMATDPKFADVHAQWAEVLSALGRQDEAARESAMALELSPTEVVYTENLIGPVQNPPAEAFN